MSRGIQELLTDESGRLALHGPEWARGKLLTPAALASVVLCERHNNALSDLDRAGLKLARTFQDLIVLVNEGTGSGIEVVLRGPDIERWMLKMLVGFCASGNAGPKTMPSIEHLQVLFGSASLGAPAGLYLVEPDRHDVPLFSGVGIDLLTRSGKPRALRLSLYGIVFALHVESKRVPPHDAVRHPGQVWVSHGSAESRIDLRWPGDVRARPTTVDLTAATGEPEIGPGS